MTKWDFKTVKNESKKYKTTIEWRRKSAGSYGWAKRNNLIYVFKPQKPLYTFDQCLKTAKKYKYRTDFMLYERNIFRYAKINGWLKVIMSHMPYAKLRTPMCVINLGTRKIYKSVLDASIKCNINRSTLLVHLSGRHKTCQGYRWAYCDSAGRIINRK